MTSTWRILKDFVLGEVAIWRMLGRWITRRPDVPNTATAVGYSQMVAPVMWVWIIASGGEAIAMELILRSIDTGWAHVVRVPLLVVGIWGTLWMLGLMASFRVRPHLILEDRLRIRSGPRKWIDVPHAAIKSFRATEHDFSGMTKTFHEEDGLLLVGVGRRTNVELVLTEPTTLATHDGDRIADRVGLWVDEPRPFVNLLRSSTNTASKDNASA